jgi:hypothetical protein
MAALSSALLLAALLAVTAYSIPSSGSRTASSAAAEQGIEGPPQSLLSGNAADYHALLAAARSAPLTSFHHSIVARATLQYTEWPAGTTGHSCIG